MKKLLNIIFLLFCFITLQPLQVSAQISVNLKANLEGPFSGGQMQAYLNPAQLPLVQPYSVAPWNYSGTENVTSIPNSNVVDWILVELRETAGDVTTAYTDNIIGRQAGFILKDGTIKSIDGTTSMQFSVSVTGNLYAVVHFRNHIPIMSANALTYVGSTYHYDFTNGSAQVYGGALAHKQISAGNWGMIAGDGNADGQVSVLDIASVWRPQVGLSGYHSGDYNINGQVDNADKVNMWKPNTGKSSQIIGPWACGLPIADDFDGKTYNTVLIGTLCWLKENLNKGLMITNAQNATNNSIPEKYCYGDNPANCNIYGGLYTWGEMMEYTTNEGGRGICPEGWHIPSKSEWTILKSFLGGDAVSGGKIKETGTSHWNSPNTGATNSSSFTALGAGYRSDFGGINYLKQYSAIWSSTSYTINPDVAWLQFLSYDNAELTDYNLHKNYSFSVRCVKDVNLPPSEPFNPLPTHGSVDQPINTTLTWSCTDPENDPLIFDVYFGITNPPVLVASGITTSTYNPGILTGNSNYNWKIIAHDDHGHSVEGTTWSFTTLTTFGSPCVGTPIVTDIEGRVYLTVQIGTQCWMAENLKTGFMIPSSAGMTDNSQIEKYCYANELTFCETYGGLYTWNEVMQWTTVNGAQGICPSNWHVPTHSDWATMSAFLGGMFEAGGNSKTTGTVEAGTGLWLAPNTGATNSSGFSGLPGGYSTNTGTFGQLGQIGQFWSSTEESSNTNKAWTSYLFSGNANLGVFFDFKDRGYSVRCIKN